MFTIRNLYLHLHFIWKLTLCTSFLLLSIEIKEINAQVLISNGNFENINLSTCPTNCDQFMAGCYDPAWKASHGSPHISSDFGGKYLVLSANTSGPIDYYEGVYFNSSISPYNASGCSFIHPGRNYTLSFKARKGPETQPTVRFKISLATFVPLRTNSTYQQSGQCGGGEPPSAFPNNPQPTGEFEVATYAISNTTWQNFSVNISPTSTYSYLWIQTTGSASSLVGLHMDNIQLTSDAECNCSDITYTNTNSLPSITKTSNSITTNQTVTDLSANTIEFIAGNYISLQPGFYIAKPFSAYIEQCQTCSICREGVYEDHNSHLALEESVQVFPNPSNGNITISYTFEPNTLVNTVVYNSIGMIVKELETFWIATEGKYDKEYSLENLPSGIYTVLITTNSGAISKKLVLTK